MPVQGFLDFVGTVKDKSVTHQGSPIQLDFPSTAAPKDVPEQIQPWNATVPTCWDNALKCSCGDCPQSPQCQLPSGADSHAAAGPCKVHFGPIGSVRCWDLAVWLPGLVLCALLVTAFRRGWLQGDVAKAGAHHGLLCAGTALVACHCCVHAFCSAWTTRLKACLQLRRAAPARHCKGRVLERRSQCHTASRSSAPSLCQPFAHHMRH